MEETVVRTINLAGCLIPYRFYFPDTLRYFKNYITDYTPENVDVYEITKQYLKDHIQMVPGDASVAYLEYRSLLMFFSDLLLPMRRCIFHGAAMVFHGKAWIFTGPSGIGKTTQYQLWKHKYPEVQIINGDKPILAFESNGQIVVHPSPWNGKENYGGLFCAPLGGIVLLVQGKKNQVKLLRPYDAGLSVLHSMIFSANTVKDVMLVSNMVEQMLTYTPVMELVNRGDEESAVLLHEWIISCGGGNGSLSFTP